MIVDALFLKDQPETEDRAAAIERERHRAMYELALGRITKDEKAVILGILNRKGD